MPRSKQRPQRSGTGEGSSSTTLRTQARRRRYQSHAAVLRELQHIQRHMQPAIPRLPFQRLVREICDSWCIGFRWTTSALMSLQEICEDWIIEFYEDSYTLAAFAHRLTIMPRDFEVLHRLRYRYDQLLLPSGISDLRMHDILSIPPLHPRSRPVAPYQPVHTRDTRSQSRRRGEDVIPESAGISIQDVTPTAAAPESPTAAPAPEPPIASPAQEQANIDETFRLRELELEQLEAQLEAEFMSLDNENQVNLGFVLGSGQNARSLVGSLDRHDLLVLRQSETLEMTDRIMQATLWYVWCIVVFMSVIHLDITQGPFLNPNAVALLPIGTLYLFYRRMKCNKALMLLTLSCQFRCAIIG